MPARGAKPKPPGQAVTRHKPLDWTEVPDVPFTGGPKLPAMRRSGKPWPDACKRKWAAWSTMPHCVLWTLTDWEFASDTIELFADMVGAHDPRFAVEVRTREKVMGTTMDYRRDIRVRYIDPPTEAPADVARLDDYRNL